MAIEQRNKWICAFEDGVDIQDQLNKELERILNDGEK